MFTYKLVEVKDDKAVVEVTVLTRAGGRVDLAKPYKTDVYKVLTPRPGAGKEGLALVRPDGTKGEDEQTVKVGKEEYKTTRFSAVQTNPFGDTLEVKVWMSEDVPGLVVKKETRNVGPMRPSFTVTEFAWVARKK